MRVPRLYLTALISILFIHSSVGQNVDLDSLKARLKGSKTDSISCEICIDICTNYIRQNTDSALLYLDMAKRLAEKSYDEKLWARSRTGDINRAFGNIKLFNNRFAEAIGYYKLAAEQYEKLTICSDTVVAQKSNIGLSDLYVNIGVTYTRMGIFDLAMEHYIKALKMYENLNNIGGMASCYLGVGTLQYYQNEIEPALESLKRSLKLYEKIGNKSGVANVYNSLGSVFLAKNDFKAAIEYFKKLLSIKLELNDKPGISAAYTNLASVYMNTDYVLAIDYFKKALSIDQELGDVYSVAIVKANIARLYVEMANGMKLSKNEKTDFLILASRNAKDAYKNADELGVLPLKNNIAELLIIIYRSLGEYQEAFTYFDPFIATKDSMYSQEKTEALAEMQTKYESEKKQQEIDTQRLIIEKQESENKRQRTQRNYLIFSSILLALLVITAYLRYQQKKRSNEIITEKNVALEQANEEILSQKDEIEAQRDMVTVQKDRLELANNRINDSLRYAESIQSAIRPSEKVLEHISPDYFVLMKPRDVVSGDFFWATTFDEYLIFCIADCTGHGVPGALMSILGITALNEIVTRHRIAKPAEILDLLRQRVMETLRQNNPDSFHKDGMDIALCVLNTKTRELHFAGAVIPLWVVTKDDNTPIDFNFETTPISANGYCLHQIKADSMPVGYLLHMDSFTDRSIKLPKSSISIYIATDGFSDQFNESDLKKFSIKRMKQLILENSDKPFNTQSQLLEQEFLKWKGSREQIDDVTVLGIRV